MQAEFEIIVWFSLEDFAFIAEVQGRPGLLAQGQTEDEAIGKLNKILYDRQETPGPGEV